MSGSTEPAGDCYSAGDRGLMVLSQRFRGRLLTPAVDALARLGVTADGLTGMSLVAGLAFCLAFAIHPLLALAFLALHVALDGLDGPLARRTGTASRRGSFADTVADQVVVIATTLSLVHAGVVGAVPGVLYLVTYTVVITFSVVRNALSAPYAWLVRPRLFVYALIPVELFVQSGILEPVLWIAVGILGFKAVTGFSSIHRRL